MQTYDPKLLVFARFSACVIFPLAIDFSPSWVYLPHLSPEEPVAEHLAAPGWMFGSIANTFCAQLLFPWTTSDFSNQKCKSRQIGTGRQRIDASGTRPLRREMSMYSARLLSGSPVAMSPVTHASLLFLLLCFILPSPLLLNLGSSSK